MGVSSLQFSSLVAYVQHFAHNQNLDFLRFLPGTYSTVTSSPYLMLLAIMSISRSIRLRAANFPPIWVWNTWLNFWFPKFIQVKTNTDSLGTAPSFQLHLEVCKQNVIITGNLWHHLPSLPPGKGIMFALMMLDVKPYWPGIAMVVFLITGVLRCNIHNKLIWKSHWTLHEGPWHWKGSHG